MSRSVRELDPSQWTLVEAVRQQAQRLGSTEFLHFADAADGKDERLSFAELDQRSDVVATALAGLGVGPGDRVLALATNCVEFVVAMIATTSER